MKKYFKRVWLKIKAWWLALLVTLGLVATPILYAEIVNFTYTPAAERTDGTPLDPADISLTRLYCDGSVVEEKAGADGTFSPNLGVGSHTCYATHVDTSGQESDPSNSVVVNVLPARPNPPVLDQP